MKRHSITRGRIYSLGGTDQRVTVNHSQMNQGTGIETPTDCYHLKFVVNGTEPYLVNEQKMTVKPGEYLLLNPEQKYEWEINSDTLVEGLCFRFTVDYLHSVVRSLLTGEDKLLDAPYEHPRPWIEMHQTVYPSATDPLGSFLSRIGERVQRGGFVLNEETSLELASRLVASQQHISAQINRVPGKKPVTQKEIFNRLCKARSIIRDRLFENVAVAELASEVHMAESHFYRSFKAAFGISPHQYHLNERVRKAAHIVVASNRSIAEIASAAGFDEPSAFTRIFKKIHGIPPLAFRNQQENKSVYGGSQVDNRWVA